MSFAGAGAPAIDGHIATAAAAAVVSFRAPAAIRPRGLFPGRRSALERRRPDVSTKSLSLAMLRAAALVFLVSLLAIPARADDAWRGWETYRQQCMACHEVGPGARHNNKAPQLNAIVGRVAGGSPGYPFSNALRNAQITWDEANMVQFLTDPQTIMPGNRHTGVKPVSVDDAENIIAYLKRFGGDGALTGR